MKYMLCIFLALFSAAQAMDGADKETDNAGKRIKVRKFLPPHLRERSLKAGSRQLIQKKISGSSDTDGSGSEQSDPDDDSSYLQAPGRERHVAHLNPSDESSSTSSSTDNNLQLSPVITPQTSPRSVTFSDEEKTDEDSSHEEHAGEHLDNALFAGSQESSETTAEDSDDECEVSTHDFTRIQNELTQDQITLLTIVCRYALIKLPVLAIEYEARKSKAFEKNLYTLLQLSYLQTKKRLQHFDLDALLKSDEALFNNHFGGRESTIIFERRTDMLTLKTAAMYILYMCDHMKEILGRVYKKAKAVEGTGTKEYPHKKEQKTKSIFKAMIADVERCFYREAHIRVGEGHTIAIGDDQRAEYQAKYHDCSFEEGEGRLYCTYYHTVAMHPSKPAYREYAARVFILWNGERY